MLPNAGLELQADLAILALGFDPLPISAMPLVTGLAATSSGTAIAVDSSQQTSIRGVFAGGDLTSGPSLILHAVRDGRRAARGIHAFLAH
jgi:glutamate synthase (NADPH/NADH) small chain